MSPAECSEEKAVTQGSTQRGAWRSCKNMGDEMTPRSAGCSIMYSEPADLAGRRSRQVRRISSLDW
eukprot:4087967-Pleurochrysis_carterae.AAC.1